MTSRTIRMVGIVGVAVLCLGSTLLPGTPARAQSEAAEAPRASVPFVTVAQVVKAQIIGRVPVSGTLVPNQEILVYPQVNGYTIDTLEVDVGDEVQRDQVLATLNARTLDAQQAQAAAERARAEAAVSQAQNQITSAQANATQANQTLQRTQTLRDAGTATQATLDQAIATAQAADAAVASARDGLAVAKAQAQQAQAQLDIAQMNLDHATLRSPAGGIISARNGQIGAIAASGGEPIFRIIRDGVVEVEAEVIENALGGIEVGDKATLDVAGVGNVAGKVRRVSPTVDATSRLGTVRITPVEQAGLRSGVFASGWIVTEERLSLAVPNAAVLTDTQGTYVLSVADGVLRKQPVEAGLIWNDLREILSGLTEGQMVVAKAGAFYGDGDAINPVQPDAATAQATGASDK